MLLIRQLISKRLDTDARACAEFVTNLPRVTVIRRALPVEDHVISIGRAAADTWREDGGELLHTVGEPALSAGAIGWRGPILHTPCKRVTAGEAKVLNWLGRRVRVTSVDQALTTSLTRKGVSDFSITDVPVPIDQSEFVRSREDLRELLGVGPEEKLVLCPGHITPISGHRLAYWAAAMLHFQNPAVRLLATGRGTRHQALEMLCERNRMQHFLRSARYLSDRELARAADVAIICADGPVEVLPILDLMLERTPIVSSESHRPIRLLTADTACLVDSPKPRFLAQAVLSQLENTDPMIASRLDAAHSVASLLADPEQARRDWIALARSLTGGIASSAAGIV